MRRGRGQRPARDRRDGRRRRRGPIVVHDAHGRPSLAFALAHLSRGPDRAHVHRRVPRGRAPGLRRGDERRRSRPRPSASAPGAWRSSCTPATPGPSPSPRRRLARTAPRSPGAAPSPRRPPSPPREAPERVRAVSRSRSTSASVVSGPTPIRKLAVPDAHVLEHRGGVAGRSRAVRARRDPEAAVVERHAEDLGVEVGDREAHEVRHALRRVAVQAGARDALGDARADPIGERPLPGRLVTHVLRRAASAAAIAATPGMFSTPERRRRSRSSPHG